MVINVGEVQTPLSSISKLTTSATGKRKRTVPDELRRRAAASCDRCKLRRSKCIKSSQDAQCVNCQAAGVECESKLPRKQRLYGSVESLSLRYRVLDALAKGLFPDVDTSDVEALLKAGQDRGLGNLPSLDDQAPVPEIFEDVSPQEPPALPTPPVSARVTSIVKRSKRPPVSPSGAGERGEKLYPAPHGVGHYVGPSSSLGFAAAVRKMVSRTSSNPKFKISRRQQNAQRVDFVSLIVNKALERRSEAPNNHEDEKRDPSISPHQASTDTDSDNGTHLEFLPARNIADALVDSFFDELHNSYPLFHREVFEVQYGEMWNSDQPVSVADLEPGWVCCLCLIFIFGAQTLPSIDRAQSISLQKRYLSLARTYTDLIISTTSLHNIQALMLIQLYYHNIGERNASWMILGCAVRMAIAMGLHREGANGGFDLREKNIRKTVWWTLYTFERNLCIILGRPSSIDETEVSVTFPDSEMESRIGLIGMTSALVSLTRLGFRIKREIYGPAHQFTDEESMISAARQFLSELQHWYDVLPSHLRIGTPVYSPHQERQVRLLEISYQQTKSLLTRPFLMTHVNSKISAVDQSRQIEPISAAMVELSSQCILAAESMLEHCKILLKEGLVNGVCWMDAYYMYFACFLLCLPLISHAVDQTETTEENQRKDLVKEVLLAMRSMRLAPTFRILVHVASQFASLVGALGDIPIETDESLRNSSTQVEQITQQDTTTTPSTNSISTPAQQPSQHQHQPQLFNQYPAIVENMPFTQDQQSPGQMLQGTSTSTKDWLRTPEMPRDFLGRTAYEQSMGYSTDWYASHAGTWDDMMFPALVGGTFSMWDAPGTNDEYLNLWGADEWQA